MAFLAELSSKSSTLQRDEKVLESTLTAEERDALLAKPEPAEEVCDFCSLSVIKSEMIYHRLNHASCILDDWLWLGAENNACNKRELTELLRVNYILNCACEVPCYFDKGEEPKLFRYMHLTRLDDRSDEDITPLIEQCTDFIHECRENKGRILVHCAMGISRSSSMVIAYLVRFEKMSVDDAYQWCKKRRPCINPNRGFFEQLRTWETSIKVAETKQEPTTSSPDSLEPS